MSELGADGGWTASAEAWVKLAPQHATRTLLLDPVMLQQAGDVQGKRVLDVGCGEGRFARLLAARGAEVVGLDPIAPILEAALALAAANERYVLGAGERLPFRDAGFDLVAFYLSLIDITDFRRAIAEAARVLKPGGLVLTANVSNIASPSEAPVYDDNGKFAYYKVGRYLDEFPMTLEWAGLRIRNWHRPMSAYTDAYLAAGLSLRRYIEPVPEDPTLRNDKRYESWFRVPSFDVWVWQKPVP